MIMMGLNDFCRISTSYFWLLLSLAVAVHSLIDDNDFLLGKEQLIIGAMGSAFAESNSGVRTKRNVIYDKIGVEDIIPQNYSELLAPSKGPGKPVVVNISSIIVAMPKIMEITKQVTTEMNFRIRWRDSRLSTKRIFDRRVGSSRLGNNSRLESASFKEAGKDGSYLVVSPAIVKHIWVPDVFINHAQDVDVSRLLRETASLRLYADGTVRYSARLRITYECPMNFRLYPADTQTCNMDFMSYGYTASNLKFQWDPETKGVAVDDIALDSDYYFKTAMDAGILQTAESGKRYSLLRLTMYFTRKLSYHLMQTYLPSSLLVVVSWLSFLISPLQIPGRMSVCMTTLLTLTAMFAAVRQMTPSVSYIRALDVWMVSCILFVFATLVEFAVVIKFNELHSRSEKKAEKKAALCQNRISSSPPAVLQQCAGIFRRSPKQIRPTSNGDRLELPMQEFRLHSGGPPGISSLTGPSKMKPPGRNYGRIGTIIERIGSIAIPATFIAFNAWYWPWLLNEASNSSNLKVKM